MKLFQDIKIGRKYIVDKSTLVCPKCKGRYDYKILGGKTCPRDGATMRYAKHWQQKWADAFGKKLKEATSRPC